MFPYLYLRTPQQVAEFDLDDFGNLTRIILTAKPEKTIMKKGEDPKSNKRYIEFTAEAITLLKRDGDKWIPVDGKKNPIGVIPVIPVYFSPQPIGTVFVQPQLYSLARVNLEMYNVSSEMRELQRGQAFAIKYMQADASPTVGVGANTMVFVPMGATIAPGQITADMGGHSALLEYKQDLMADFMYIARQNGVVGVETSQSGIAKEWDFRAEEGLLKHSAGVAELAEYAIADMFKLYTKVNYFYSVQYPDDFAPASTMGMLDVLDKYSLMENVPDSGKKLAAIVATRTVFADQPAESIDEIVNDIESEAEDVAHSEDDVSGDTETDDLNA